MVGCLQGKTLLNIRLTGEEAVNGKRDIHKDCKSLGALPERVEASPGIEPGCKDLQSSA